MFSASKFCVCLCSANKFCVCLCFSSVLLFGLFFFFKICREDIGQEPSKLNSWDPKQDTRTAQDSSKESFPVLPLSEMIRFSEPFENLVLALQ